MRGLLVGTILLVTIAGRPSAELTAQTPQLFQVSKESHIQWVADIMKRMATIREGMTRGELLTVFEGSGGLSTRLQRTYVSRDCFYFQVDVEFRAVATPSRDAEGRVTPQEDERDVIVRISRPYVAGPVID